MSDTRDATGDRVPRDGYGRWLAFWAQFIVLGLCAVLGAFVAGQGGQPGDYLCGMLLALGSVAFGFMRLKAWFDGAATDWSSFLLVDRLANLWLVVPLFAIIGLAGLFIAAGWEYGSLHDAGITLFVVAGLAVFLNLKRVFDRIDRRW